MTSPADPDPRLRDLFHTSLRLKGSSELLVAFAEAADLQREVMAEQVVAAVAVKVVAQRDGPILGFHLVGPWASELLHEGYLAVNWEALPSDVGRLIHAHPSLSEAIGETMITFSGRSLHG
jgi:pyruvate/2-oxoglutarate dehydrogenase complex dihydrolipoamide dehydrogenase (E3) component